LSWFKNLKGDNFLAVLDVMIDIKNEIDILSDVIQIPIMQTKIRFPQLCPVNSTDMRDKYCNLRWKATKFLFKNGIIESSEILQDGHRFKAFMKIELDRKKFIKEYKKIIEKYQIKREGKMDIKEIKEKRFQFLYSLYNLSDLNEDKIFKTYKLGKKLGFSDNFTSTVRTYLNNKGLIRLWDDIGRDISISHDGIIEVEDALSKPDEPTEHFPPAKNVINIFQNIEGSQIQIGSPSATQIQTSNKELIDKLKELLSFIESNSSQLKFSGDKEQEFQADVKTIEAQALSSKPKRNILKESLASMRTILESVAGQIIAKQILDKLPVIVNML